jgi:hypothetical protein
MKTSLLFPVSSTLLLLAARLSAADYRVEVLKEDPPDGLSEKVAEQLAPAAVRVVRGTSRVICDVWLCKQWTVKPEFQGVGEVRYPFLPGQLMGAVRYVNKGGDFRDQDIDKGIYTLRYDQMPADGNHEGVFPTRDFLLLAQAKGDKSPALMDSLDLWESSADAVGTTHPAMLCLLGVQGEVGASPSIRHDEKNDWWIVRLTGKAKVGEKAEDLAVDLVVVGEAEEL